MAWGGPTERHWRGIIRLTDGQFQDLRLLGLDADQPGTFVLQENQVLVEPRKANRYAGLEVTVRAPYPDAQIEIVLSSGTDDHTVRVSLADLVASGYAQSLGGDQRLRIARAAGDGLRVTFPSDALVFAPGERVPMGLTPNRLNVKPNSPVRARLRLKRSRDDRSDAAEFWNQEDVVWSTQRDLRADNQGSLPAEQFEMAMPDEEGVYDLTIDLVHRPLTVKPAIARRQVQFVVIDSQRPPLFGDRPGTEVSSFNPANPRWYEQLPQWRLLPRQQKGPWSNGGTSVQPAYGKSWTRLETGRWVAYSLPVTDLNVPHVLEIEFPPNTPQDVGVSILQENVSTSLAPVSLNSGVALGDPDLDTFESTIDGEHPKHRLVFWPRTTSPIVLIANQDPTRAADFGTIRLEAYRQGLPLAATSSPQSRRRIAMFRRPLLKQVFLARDGFDDRNFSFDDWTTFYQSGQRLIEYLRYAGYDGVSLAAVAEGSALYPSDTLRPTPKYDRGVYANTGQDPRRKDVLEMLFRMFDREGLALLPGIEFTAPLPELERQLAEADPQAIGIEVAPGLPSASEAPAPYYNPTHERVQDAMVRVVRELTDRYGNHPAFGGVQLHTSPDSYLQIPGLDWGLDTHTMRQFAKQYSEQTPEAVKQELQQAVRSRHRDDEAIIEDWRAWRARQLTALYKKLASHVTATGVANRLYLSVQGLIDTPGETGFPTQSLLDRGIDVEALRQVPSLALIRSTRIASLSDLALIDNEVDSPRVATPTVVQGFTASEFSHQPRDLDWERFDPKDLKLTDVAKGVTSDSSAKALLATHGQRARSYYAHSLARFDDRVILDGGQVIAMGQESATKTFFEVFRQLPDRPFRTVTFPAAQPVVVRIAADGNESFVYFVNDSPWKADVLVEWEAAADCTITPVGNAPFSTSRSGGSNGLASIEPYGLFALRFSDPLVKISSCRTDLPPGTAKRLLDQYDKIAMRAGEVKRRSPDDEAAGITPSERNELQRVLTVAYNQQNKNDLAGCYRTLSGYWPRYLLRHVKPAPRITVKPEPPVANKVTPKPTTRFIDRLRRIVPNIRF